MKMTAVQPLVHVVLRFSGRSDDVFTTFWSVERKHAPDAVRTHQADTRPGTRDAAALWQDCFAQHLESIGFERGRSNPCVLYHKSINVRTVVHGDDYMSAGQ